MANYEVLINSVPSVGYCWELLREVCVDLWTATNRNVRQVLKCDVIGLL